MKTDAELLREYAQSGDEAAFAEVVRRHADFVYSAALRLLHGEQAAAQDVAQMVFADLARKAPALAHRPTLAGWLHTSARYAAITYIRRERRRREREHEAAAMPDTSAEPAVDWDHIRPLLDVAVGELRERDREAVLLRYFHNRSHREVGTALGLSEDSARKAVERALEKLRAQFARRGVAASAALLAVALPAHAMQPAPAAWASGAAGAALTTPAAGLGATLFTFLIMNAKLATLVVLGITATAIACPWLLRQANATVDETTATLPDGPAQSDQPAPTLPSVSVSSPPAPTAGTVPLMQLPPAGMNPAENPETAARAALALSQRVDGLGISEPVRPGFDPLTIEPRPVPSPLEEKVLALIEQSPAAIRPYNLEIFALDPGTTSSYRIRGDVVQIPLRAPVPGYPREMPRGTAYYVPRAGNFYIQWSPWGSSTHHYYGPFQGDPRQVLGLQNE